MTRRIHPFKPLLDKIPTPLKNKYIITLCIFFFIIVFINKVNPFTQWSLQNTKSELEDKKEYYEKKLDKVKNDKVDNVKNVEKFARENYYMKKNDEDVFIIVEQDSENDN